MVIPEQQKTSPLRRATPVYRCYLGFIRVVSRASREWAETGSRSRNSVRGEAKNDGYNDGDGMGKARWTDA